MKSTMRPLRVLPVLALLAGFLILSSFTRPAHIPAGGMYYEIYLGEQVVVRQWLGDKFAVKEFALLPAHQGQELRVVFSHCGKIGTGRTITLKSGGQTVQQWRFNNVSDAYKAGSMLCPIKTMATLQEQHSGPLQLYYNAKELDKEVHLLTLVR